MVDYYYSTASSLIPSNYMTVLLGYSVVIHFTASIKESAPWKVKELMKRQTQDNKIVNDKISSWSGRCGVDPEISYGH